ncbi:MAG: hypothetical protein AMXMBFR34_39530 [Myxococcaceae bacterium]
MNATVTEYPVPTEEAREAGLDGLHPGARRSRVRVQRREFDPELVDLEPVGRRLNRVVDPPEALAALPAEAGAAIDLNGSAIQHAVAVLPNHRRERAPGLESQLAKREQRVALLLGEERTLGPVVERSSGCCGALRVVRNETSACGKAPPSNNEARVFRFICSLR